MHFDKETMQQLIVLDRVNGFKATSVEKWIVMTATHQTLLLAFETILIFFTIGEILLISLFIIL